MTANLRKRYCDYFCFTFFQSLLQSLYRPYMFFLLSQWLVISAGIFLFPVTH